MSFLVDFIEMNQIKKIVAYIIEKTMIELSLKGNQLTSIAIAKAGKYEIKNCIQVVFVIPQSV